jgi:hypothetical protein
MLPSFTKNATTFSGMKTSPAGQMIENMLGHLKDWRQVAMRFDSLAEIAFSPAPSPLSS